MEIKLTIELKKPKNTGYKSMIAAAEENSRALIEELKEFGSKAAFPLVSTHSNWAIEINESDWECDFFSGIWYCDFKLQLKIAEVDSGDIVDESLAWELLGEPVGREVFEPLHSCDWSGLQGRERIDLLFSSLKAIPNNKQEGLYFHYDYS